MHFKLMFKDDFKLYDSSSKEFKSHIAYHECGHALLVLLDNDNSFSLNGIKIVNDCISESQGITYMNSRIARIQLPTREYTVKKLAIDLAGRIAEKNDNMGAGIDLESANEIAQGFVLGSGLTKIGRNYICMKDDFFLSEAKKALIETEIQNLLDEAEKYARTMILKYQEFIDELIPDLIKYGVMSAHKIKRKWKKYNKL